MPYTTFDNNSNIYRLTYDVESTACFLFISRHLTENIRKISKFEFDLFEELYEQTFTTKINKKDWAKKIIGIIINYQKYFQEIHNKNYETGLIESIMTHVHFDLLALSFYLDFWENSNRKLSDIDKNGVLKAIYEKYWKDLTRDERNCLLHYISLYYFEIEFESFHEYSLEEATRSLAEKGIILKKVGGKRTECYSFYHSSFSALLIEAYIFENTSIFRRKYNNSYDNFLFDYIRDYILAFEEYGYPINLFLILHNLFTHQINKNIHGNKIAQKLFTHEKIKKVVSLYYLNEVGNAYEITELLTFLSKNNENALYHFMSKLIFDNPQYKGLLLNSEYPTRNYYAILNILSPYSREANKFSEILTIDEIKASLYQSELNNVIGTIRDLKSIQNVERQELIILLLQEFETSHLVELVQKANFSKLTDALYELYSIQPNISRKVLKRMDLKLLVLKAELKQPEKLVGLLRRLRQIDARKTRQILDALDKDKMLKRMEHIDIGQFISILSMFEKFDRRGTAQEILKNRTIGLAKKIKDEEKFHNITKILSLWSRTDIGKARSILNSLDVDDLGQKIEFLNLERIGNSLSEIKKIDLRKTRQILHCLSDKRLVEKTKESKFANIGKALNEIRLIDAQKAYKVLEQLKEINTISTKAKEATFVQITKALNEIRIINPNVAQEILFQLDFNELVKKSIDSKFNHLGTAFKELSHIDIVLARNILSRVIEEDEFLEKAKNAKFNILNKVLIKLKEVDYKLTREFLESFPNKVVKKKLMNNFMQ